MANVLYEPWALLHEKRPAELVASNKDCDTRHEKPYCGQSHSGTWEIWVRVIGF